MAKKKEEPIKWTASVSINGAPEVPWESLPPETQKELSHLWKERMAASFRQSFAKNMDMYREVVKELKEKGLCRVAD